MHATLLVGKSSLKLRLAMTMSTLMILVLIGAAKAQTLLARPLLGRELLQADPNVVRKLCTAPGFEQKTCTFADKAEEDATAPCLYCGTIARILPRQLPAELEGHHTYNQFGIKMFSLTCKGPVVVRSVFKMHEGYPLTKEPDWLGTNCTNAGMVHLSDKPTAEGGTASAVIRCELQLPASGGSEVERALKSKEVKCWQCGRCSNGQGCPSNYGVWYSDTFTTVANGCNMPSTGVYDGHRVGFNINPKTKALLAKFEVCNSPGCFDAAYEQAKQKAAKQCIKAKCTE